VERERVARKYGLLARISVAIMKMTGIYIIIRTRPHYGRSVEPKQHSQDMLKMVATLFHTADTLSYLQGSGTAELQQK
jgi:hypothetical protein